MNDADMYNLYPVAVYKCDDSIIRIVIPGVCDSKPYHEFTNEDESLEDYIETLIKEIMSQYETLPIPITAEINLDELAETRKIENIISQFLVYCPANK